MLEFPGSGGAAWEQTSTLLCITQLTLVVLAAGEQRPVYLKTESINRYVGYGQPGLGE